MSRSKEELEASVNEFIRQAKDLSDDDKKKLLMSMVEKHIVLNSSDFNISYWDFQEVRSNAMNLYVSTKLPMSIDKKGLTDNEAIQFLLLDSFTSFLNYKNALKRMPKYNKE